MSSISIGNARQLLRDFGTCLKFTGSGESVELGTANPFTGDFYFSTWFYWLGNNGSYQQIFNKRDAYAQADLMFSMSFAQTTNELVVDMYGDPAPQSFNSTYYPTPNKWTHLIWEHSPTNNRDRIYINGNIVTPTLEDRTLGSGTDALISIGAAQNPATESFNGYFDETAIGTGLLTEQQAYDIFTKSTYPTNSLWSLLKYDEGSGTTATDSSGNGNNGTITDATYATNKPAHSGTRTLVGSRPKAQGNFYKIQSVSNATGGAVSLVITLSAPAVANHLIVVNVKTGVGGSSSATVTDNASTPNTYIKAVGPTNNGAFRMYQFYGVQVTGGATQITVTLNSSDSIRVGVNEFSGNALTNALVYDTSTSKSGTGTSGAVDAFSPLGTGELIVAGYGLAAAGTPAAGTDYTLITGSTTNNAEEYRLSSDSSETAPMIWTNSVAWTAVVGAYKPLTRQSI